jgi:hypothetical protein
VRGAMTSKGWQMAVLKPSVGSFGENCNLIQGSGSNTREEKHWNQMMADRDTVSNQSINHSINRVFSSFSHYHYHSHHHSWFNHSYQQ